MALRSLYSTLELTLPLSNTRWQTVGKCLKSTKLLEVIRSPPVYVNSSIISYYMQHNRSSNYHQTKLFSTYSTHKQTRKDLYSILGVSSHATQAEIKKAYYNLSMKYHPDRNMGTAEAHSAFKKITEAYTVLGEYARRRKYDKGLLREYPPPNIKYRPHKPHDSTQKAPIYDFDAFYKAHYGEALKRERQARRKKAAQKNVRPHSLTDAQQQLVIIAVPLLVFISGWCMYSRKYRRQRNRLVEPEN